MDRGNNEFGAVSEVKVGAGLNQVRSPLEAVHPVQTSEKHYLRNREMAEMAQLRKMQGIHAPIRIQMEKRLVTAHQGHLPCMTTREGWQDQEPGGDLPVLPAHQRVRDYRPLPGTGAEGRGAEDYARAEADQGRSEDQVQGLRRYWRLQRPRRAG